MSEERDFVRPPLRADAQDPCCFYTLYVGDAPDGIEVQPRIRQMCEQSWQYRYDQIVQDDWGQGMPQVSPALDHTMWVRTTGMLFPETLVDNSVYTPCIYSPGDVPACQTELFNTTLIARDYCNTLTHYIRCSRPYPPPSDLENHINAERAAAVGRPVDTSTLAPLPPKHGPGEPSNVSRELENLLFIMECLDAHRGIQINKSQQRVLLFARHSDTLALPPDINTWFNNFATVCTVLAEPRSKEVVKLYCWPKGCEVLVCPVENRMAEVLVRDHADCPMVDCPRLMNYLLPKYKPKHGAVASIMSTSTRRGLIGGDDDKKAPSAAEAAAAVKGAAAKGGGKMVVSAKKAGKEKDKRKKK